MLTRQMLELALAKAEANLHLAVNELAVPGCDRGVANERVNKARADCRSAYAALNGHVET
jgi:hypothetical protein